MACQAPLSMEFPDKNTGVGCHFLLQGIFPPRDWTCVACTGRQIFFFFFFTAEPPGTPWPCGMSWLFPFYRWGLDQSSSLSKVSTLEISKVEFGMHIPDCLGVLSTPSQWFVPSVTLALEIQTRQPLSYLHPWLPFSSKNPLKFGGVTKAKRSVFI